MIILIPAYKPDKSLVLLCKQLLERGTARSHEFEMVVVDDGSGPEFAPIFESIVHLGSRINLLSLGENSGKGDALKAGFSWCALNRPGTAVVTADADGQHLPVDILAVGELTEIRQAQGTSALILGVRTMIDPCAPNLEAPLRSRFGNAATVGFFTLATGQRVVDTQTGLRGFTPDLLAWATEIPGNRYDYEFTTLLRATRASVTLEQLPITRVYELGNPTSHFRPVLDSLRIYLPLLAFLMASFSGFLIDTVALLCLVAAGVPLLASVVGARCLSALANFALNRVVMYDGGARPRARTSLLRYAILAVLLLVANAAFLEALLAFSLPLVVAKIIVEFVLIPVSFAVQRRWVFLPRQERNPVVQEPKRIEYNVFKL